MKLSSLTGFNVKLFKISLHRSTWLDNNSISFSISLFPLNCLTRSCVIIFIVDKGVPSEWAAAAHSLGTPLSTIKIITQDLIKQFKGQKDIEKDIELLSSQVERCNLILKRLSINPVEEDDFIDKDITMKEYLNEIIISFKEISKKNFIFNFDQDANSKKITKSIEIVYGLRNFVGNANKFAKDKIFISLKSNNEITEIIIEDDGNGYPRDILSKIGEPYLKSNYSKDKSKQGLGLGLFIGKTLLEKNFASVNFRNSKTRSGAEVNIKWKNKELFNI